MSLQAPDPTHTQVWGDVRCPWCWIGFRRLYAAAASSGSDTKITHRSFLLEPSGPAGARTAIAEVAVTSWGMSEIEWAARSEQIRQTGDEVGLEINIDGARQVDSRDAHRLLKLAEHHGADARRAWDCVFDAHLRRNVDIEDHDVLVGLGRDLGLDEDDVRDSLSSSVFTQQVMADHEQAASLGMRAVPSFLTGGRILSGAVQTTELIDLLESAEGAHR